jgi:ABC-type transport system involved in multi-copper enzyme maturation permease subunit
VTATATAYRSELRPGRDGFPQLLRAEWTKLRTVRGWVVGLLAAVLVTVGIGVLAAVGDRVSCVSVDGGSGASSNCHPTPPPVGPDGEAVTDSFYFVHQPLVGDGSLTVRVTALTGQIPADDPGNAAGPSGMRSGLAPWAKAGLIVKANTTQGSAYAAIMITASHGVRMQDNYTHDTAGRPGAVSATSPRWLRLTRSGDTLTGYESADGTNWTQVGSVQLAGLPSTVPAGLFIASPDYEVTDQRFGGTSSTGGPSRATAGFDNVSVASQRPAAGWTGDQVGGLGGGLAPDTGFQEAGGTVTVTGSGDIAPVPGGPGPNTVEQSLVGAFAGLIVLIVVGTMFVTAEYRRGLIRTTLAASPRRGRALAAKAVVLGCVTFVTGLVAAGAAFGLVGWIRRRNGHIIVPVTSLTELRVVAGTAAVLAVAAVLALALGTVLRRSAGTVTAGIVLLVLPYLLAVASVLPSGPAQWLLRVTPAAAFAIQQSIPQYPQLATTYTPSTGYYPLAPWVGFAVLCAWTAAALGLAVVLLRRRDA